MCRRISLILLPVLLCAALSNQAAASAVRIFLRGDVSVSSDVILLSHLVSLLPEELQKVADKISFGNSPKLGTLRLLHREELLSAISEGGLDTSDFDIPESVTVRRAGRPLTKGEINMAIEKYFAQKGISNTGVIETPELTVPDDDLGLFVRRTVYDSALHRNSLTLESRRFPGMAPFAVAVPPIPKASQSATTPAAGNFEKELPLVRPGERVQMIVSGAGTHMILTVIPLAAGRNGEVIRVRVANTSKYLNARVIAKNTVEASYQEMR